MMIVDEALDSVDYINKNNIFKLIEYMKSYYDWVFIISHNQDIKNNCDMNINIIHTSLTEKQINI